MYASSLAFPILLLSILLLAANEIAQPPQNLRPKVFVIGLSKTGTTSFGDALSLLGYKRLGWKDIRSRHLVHSYVNGEVQALVDQTKYYDAFEDLPWPRVYREMAAMYPDSKFILSLRKDEETWLRSMQRHVGRGRWLPYTHFYGADTYEGNEDVIRSSYRNHTEAVREFFSDKPHRYLELKIDDGDANWSKMCRFLGFPETAIPSTSFPKSNTAASWEDGSFVSSVRFFWGWSITRLEELGSYYVYEKKQPSISAVLSLAWRAVSVIEQACSETYYKYVSQPQNLDFHI